MGSSAPFDEVHTPRPGEELDARTVACFLERELPGFRGPAQLGQFPGGASNLTYLVRSSEGREWVLRRPPAGTKARSAHDMGREYSVLSRIHQAFPYAPRPVLFCGDRKLLGEEFYLMQRLEGKILRRELPAGMTLPPGDAHQLCRNLVDVHVELHAIDLEATGLAGLGRPEGYIARQVSGWSKRYRAVRTEDVPDNEWLMGWLQEHQPDVAPRAALIHNDYKFDNVVLGRTDAGWRITGVLDWEMATIGDPLMDLGASLAYWVQADDPEFLQQVRMLPTHLPGMMRRAELVEYYCKRASREPERFEFYYVYGLFRLAVIVQQIYFRFVHGQTRNPRFAPFGRYCNALSEAATSVASGARGF